MIRCSAIIFILGLSCLPAFGASIGAELPLEDGGNVDGWSGIPVMYGHELPAGESVTTVTYYAADNLFPDVEDEIYNVVPLIVMQEDGSVDEGEGIFTVWEVGPAHKPSETGENSFAWGSSKIPNDGNLYHPAALQWPDERNDQAGGVISFANGVGEGMHFFNVDTTDYIPNEDLGEVEAGLELSALETHSSGVGGRHYQLNFETGSAGAAGDFNNDGEFDGADIDSLSVQVQNAEHNLDFDLTGDGQVNPADRTFWVKDIKKTWFGDANFDGEFNSSDLVAVFQGGLFETDSPAGWEVGDWDGDGKFNSSDFVIAFQDGGFELGPLPAANAVPEPNSLAFIGCLMLLVIRRRR